MKNIIIIVLLIVTVYLAKHPAPVEYSCGSMTMDDFQKAIDNGGLTIEK